MICRSFNWHDDPSAADAFEELAKYCRKNNSQADLYGKGEFKQKFEEEIAELLGKENAVFMPSGVMAQQTALRIWADRSGGKRAFGLHPTNHIEVNEHRAYSYLHNLQAVLLGERNSVITAKDLKDNAEQIFALVLELPLRRLGGLLPSWKELQAIIAFCKMKGIKLHLDGARLWETACYYQKSYKEICQDFDSVYVSFYKGLGGLAGSMLLGEADFMAESKIWLRRLGGNLVTMHPYVASAKLNYEKRIDKMSLYHDRAVSLAKELQNQCPEIQIRPEIPHTNMFHLFVNTSVESLSSAHETLIKEHNIKLCTRFTQSDVPHWTYTEVVIGDAALQFSDSEIVPLYKRLFELVEV